MILDYPFNMRLRKILFKNGEIYLLQFSCILGHVGAVDYGFLDYHVLRKGFHHENDHHHLYH